MDGLETTPEELAFARVIEDMTRGRVRVRAEFVPVIQAVVGAIAQQHVAALDTLTRKGAKGRTSAEVMQMAYRRHAIKALAHAITIVGQPVRRTTFWDVATQLTEAGSKSGEESPDPAA